MKMKRAGGRLLIDGPEMNFDLVSTMSKTNNDYKLYIRLLFSCFKFIVNNNILIIIIIAIITIIIDIIIIFNVVKKLQQNIQIIFWCKFFYYYRSSIDVIDLSLISYFL